MLRSGLAASNHRRDGRSRGDQTQTPKAFRKTVESPNHRAGAGLSQYIDETRLHLDRHRQYNKTISLHFFSEGDVKTFAKFQDNFPNATMHVNEVDWVDALDVMTQSNVLIGGISSFFALAAHLCHNCTVISAGHESSKFNSSMTEKNLTNYRKVIGFNGKSNL